MANRDVRHDIRSELSQNMNPLYKLIFTLSDPSSVEDVTARIADAANIVTRIDRSNELMAQMLVEIRETRTVLQELVEMMK